MLVVKEITIPSFGAQIRGSLQAEAGFLLSSGADCCDRDVREGCREASYFQIKVDLWG